MRSRRKRRGNSDQAGSAATVHTGAGKAGSAKVPTAKVSMSGTLSLSPMGYAIFNAQQYFQSARIVVGMLTIGIVWLAMDRLILRPIEQRTTMRWGLVREGLEQA